MSITHALKEWNVAVQALAEGETVMLLRKGGIREVKGTFDVPVRTVWLYPTFEHQKPEWLKPEYAEQVQIVSSGWHPESVTIQAWATVTHVIQVTNAAQVDALYPFHIWTREFAEERFQWKVRSPLYVLLLRVYRLAHGITIPFDDAYKGCRSWVELQIGHAHYLDLNASIPAISDHAYATKIHAVENCLNNP